MIVFSNPEQALHSAQQEMFRGRMVPCHEQPARHDQVLAELRRRPVGPLRAPQAISDADLARVHSPQYLQFLASAWSDWVAADPANAERDALPSVWPGRGLRADAPTEHIAARLGQFSFDAGTPLMAGSWRAARAGAACAISAARQVAAATSAAERSAFVLTRPPGHHAGVDFFGGYCFLNNAALAAQTLRDRGIPRVAVLDVDYHHGNGTQQIFYERSDVLTVSIHGDPRTEYPFYLGYAEERGAADGIGFNLNLPLPRGSGFGLWSVMLAAALEAVDRFGADALVVSLGVDGFEADPISGFRLQSDDFHAIGAEIGALQLPTVLVLEGGYAVAELGRNVVNVLEGFNSRFDRGLGGAVRAPSAG